MIVSAIEVPYSEFSLTIGDLVDLHALGFLVLDEVHVDPRDVGADRRRAEEPFEAPLGQARRDRGAGQERLAIALGDGAGRLGDAGLIGAVERVDVLLRDQAQCLVLAGRRAALLVGEHQLDLAPTEVGQARGPGQRHRREIGMLVVDEVDREFERSLGRAAGRGGVAGQRQQRADAHGPVLGSQGAAGGEAGRQAERQQRLPRSATVDHDCAPLMCPVRAGLSAQHARSRPRGCQTAARPARRSSHVGEHGASGQSTGAPSGWCRSRTR